MNQPYPNSYNSPNPNPQYQMSMCPPYVPNTEAGYNYNNPNTYSSVSETYTMTTTGVPYGNQGYATSSNMMGVTGTGTSGSRILTAPTIYNKAVIQQPQTQTSVQYIPYQTKQIVYDTVEKREMVPIQKTYTEYEQLKHIETIPVQKTVTDFYAVQHRTDYVPTVTSEKVVDYVQQQVINQQVNYRPVETTRVIGNSGGLSTSGVNVTSTTVTSPGFGGSQAYSQYDQYSQQYGQQYGQGVGLTGPAVMTGSGVGSVVQPVNGYTDPITNQLANGMRNNSLF